MHMKYLLLLCLLYKTSDSVCTRISFFRIKVTITYSKSQSNVVTFVEKCIDEDLNNAAKIDTLLVSDKFENLHSGAVKNLPMLAKLTFSGNGIKYISENAFQNLPNLKILYIKNNALSEFHNAYGNLKSLGLIDFSGNKISSIEKQALGIPDLEYLQLNYNNLMSLEKNIFNGKLYKLTYFSLQGNQISYIEPNFFEFTPNLCSLDLSYNKLMTISQQPPLIHLTHLQLTKNNLMHLELLNNKFSPKLQFISIELNPWNCKCYFRILRWIDSKHIIMKIRHREEPICVHTKFKVPTCTEEIDHEAIEYYTNNIKY